MRQPAPAIRPLLPQVRDAGQVMRLITAVRLITTVRLITAWRLITTVRRDAADFAGNLNGEKLCVSFCQVPEPLDFTNDAFLAFCLYVFPG